MVAVVRRGRRAGWRLAVAPALLTMGLVTPTLPTAASHAEVAQDPARLHLVTFEMPGTAGHRGRLDLERYEALLERHQDAALGAVAAGRPAYRWTTALSGVAVELTGRQATLLRSQPHVATVEENTVRPLAGSAAPRHASAREVHGRGGAGVVVGIVDTGIWPESPLFADSPALGQRPRRFAGSCAPAEDWVPGTCNAKVVAAEWFVTGFGEDRLAADEPLSARDVRGHGTQVAAIAAGNEEVSVAARGLGGSYSGRAPLARVAVYKACWSAPDPDDDGCATADLVTAIDRATEDGVDVLNLSVTGAPEIDTVGRALLGAAEAGTVVVAAAGNAGDTGYATHVAPWVTTVGGLTNPEHAGEVLLGPDHRLAGVMTAREGVTAGVVAGRTVPAPGHAPADAALCIPGALDASHVAGRIVVCERGSIGRITKSAAVERADGAGMVLLNTRPGPVAHDRHAVPTVHLGATAGRELTHWLSAHPGAEITLSPTRRDLGRARVATWSPGGDPTGSFLKPDLVAPATGILGSVPPTAVPERWAYLSGTSAAAAWTSGTAAILLSRHDWSAPVVRSVLASSGHPTGDSILRSGAGVPHVAAAARGRLAHDVAPGHYRAWLSRARPDVNTPSLLFKGEGTATRRLTNVGERTGTWRAEVTGFEAHDVSVSPTVLALRPGDSARYRVTVSGGSAAAGLDDGSVSWVAADGSETRVPVAVGR